MATVLKTLDALLEKYGQEDTGLYVMRPVVNGQQLYDWAIAHGLTGVLAPEDMHVTIVYSPASIQWTPAQNELAVPPGAFESLQPLGNEGALVLRFESAVLRARWQAARDRGAEWSYESYHPHVTVAYGHEGPVPDSVPDFPLVFGPEVQDTIRENPLAKALSPARQASYDKETASIRERAKTPEAQQPHTFQAAEWTHPNGHPRCKVCGDKERTGGMCDGVVVKYAPDQARDERGQWSSSGSSLPSDIQRVLPGRYDQVEASALFQRLKLQGRSSESRRIILHDWGRADRAGKDAIITRSWEGLDQPWMQKGGPGSGNFGHAGRPGQVGGSEDGDGEAGGDDITARLKGPSMAQQRTLNAGAETWQKTLSNDKRRAFRIYSSDSGSAETNEFLRHNSINGIKVGNKELPIIKELDAAIAKHTLPETITVFRGVSNLGFDNVNVGQTFKDKAYSSTTLRLDTAKKFASGKNATLLVITVQAGTSAAVLDVDRLSEIPDEHEVILPRGSRFRVDRKEKKGRRTIMHVSLL